MWFSELVKYLKSLFSLNNPKKEIIKESPFAPNRKLCETLLKELNSNKLTNYSVSVGLSITIQPLYPDIETYIKKLKEAVVIIKYDKKIPREWGIAESRSMTLDHFLITSDGYYVDVPKAVEIFKEAGIKLCEIMEESDTAQYGVPEYNLRMLTNLFINLREITKKLIEVSVS